MQHGYILDITLSQTMQTWCMIPFRQSFKTGKTNLLYKKSD